VPVVVTRINLRAPVIFLVLAAIAIPIELTPPGHRALELTIDVSHVFVNVLGFVPVGLVLGEFGVLWAVAAAALMSGLAETGQLVMLYRDASVSDFVANVMGAFLGAVVGAHWKIRSPALTINRWTTCVAAALALALVVQVWTENRPVSTRGTTSPGTLEAHWKLDETGGRVAVDSSGNDLNGRFNAEPERVSRAGGTAVVFDGKKVYIEVGRSTALRLAGSMTITAWINSSSFPYDDAAIVSQLHGGFGYQLDTTIDKGPRTVGFKVSHVMARYGATPLVIGVWYHVAGVYDAPRRTLNVYLNGKQDDGPLTGPVTGAQHSSRWPTYIGRRSDLDGFGFAGLIRDVRIYSLALTNDEIAAVMRGESLNRAPAERAAAGAASNTSEAGGSTEQNPQYTVISEPGDQWFPVMAASVGALMAVASIGLWPSASSLLYVFSSFAAGLLLLPAIVPNVPSFNLWLIPLVAVAGGMSVVVSARRYPDSDWVEARQWEQLR
jgi:Concanavalin A-like lectin/glucanases superfamily/VanZ like family